MLQKEPPIMLNKKFVLQGPRLEAHTGLRSRYHVLVHARGRGFVENQRLPSIVLDKGALIVGSVPVHTVRVTADHFTWVQQSPGRYTSGHLYTVHDGQDIHGVVYIGTSPSDATEHAFVGTAAKPARYETSVTKGTYPKGTDPKTVPDGEWSAGPILEIGYETVIGESAPRTTVKLGDVQLDGQEEVTWTYDASQTVLKIHANDVTCGFASNLFKLASIGFNAMDLNPDGWGDVSQICGDGAPLKDDVVRFWKAVPARAALRAAPALETIKREDVVALSSGAELTLKELIKILPDQKVSEDTQIHFVRNMKWAMGQDGTQKGWLTDLLGESPPALKEYDETLVKKGLEFYQKFSKGYLASAFQRLDGPNAPEHKLSKDQELLLTTFLTQGLAKEKDYNTQHMGTFIGAYKEAHPRLLDYINDTKHNWADELYKASTGGPEFILAVNRVAGCLGDPAAMTPVNNRACLLNALDPTGTKAKKYYNAVVTGVVQSQVPKVLTGSREDLMQWLPDALHALLEQLALGGQDREGITKAEANEMYQYYLKNASQLTTGLANLLLAVKTGNLIERALAFEQGAQDLWGKVAGGFAKIGKLFLAIGWVGGLASAFMAFTGGIKNQWLSMTDPQKAKFVTGIAQTVMQAIDAVPILWKGITALLQEGKDIARLAWAGFIDAVNSAVVIGKVDSEVEAVYLEIGQREAAVAAAYELSPWLSWR